METVRTSHEEQIERWALFVKNNPHSWKKTHTKFINAIFAKHYQFHDELLKTPQGKEKLKKLYQINNIEGYKWLR